MTDEFRKRLEDGETLDDILPEAFATVREAARRTLGQRAFDVQLMGGAALHLGNISEMRTGEGKTLTGVFPAYLNALSGKGVHVVTTNDYLAKRDSEWMGGIYRFLGLKVGLIQASMSPEQRRPAYGVAERAHAQRPLGHHELLEVAQERAAQPRYAAHATPDDREPHERVGRRGSGPHDHVDGVAH